jgi:hypothetical protein
MVDRSTRPRRFHPPRAALAVAPLLIALASACAGDRSAPAPTPTSSSPSSAADDEAAEVARRLARLKAEMAITPHFCSLENRPCRTAKRPLIERCVAALLERCGGKSRRAFDRCLASETSGVVASLGES